MYANLDKAVYWIVAVISILIPVMVNMNIDPSFPWTLSLLFPFMIVVMYPSWNVGFTALFIGGGIKYATEFYGNSGTFQTELTDLVTNSIAHGAIFLVVAHFRIRYQKTSQKLEESEKRYKSLFDTNPDAIFSIDTNKHVTTVNASGEKMFGYPSQFMIHQSYEPFIHPSYRDEVNRFYHKALQGEAQEYETIAVHADSSLIALRVTLIPMVVDGKIDGVYGVAKNITVYQQTLNELIEANEKLESFYRNTSDAIDIVDLEYHVIQVNPAFERMYGWKQEEIIGKRLPIIPEFRFQESRELVNKLLAGEHIPSFDVVCYRKDGASVEVSLTLSPIRDSKGEIVAISGITRDITQKKQYEKQLEHLAFHDGLTGLPNRRLFTAALEQAMKESVRYERHIAVMYMDLDRFKQINDDFGHEVGDELLKQFAQRVKGCLRRSDMLARLGGDEFVILLEIKHESDIPSITNKIMDALREDWNINGHILKATSSMGVAVYDAGTDTQPQSLIKRADMALYQAKQKGRNNCQFIRHSEN